MTTTRSSKRPHGHATPARGATKRRASQKRAPAEQEVGLDDPRVTSSDALRDALPETSIGGDLLSEALGEAAVERATGVNDPEESLRNEEVDEERGGPFVITSGDTEFAHGTDLSNPRDAMREPLPTV